MPTLFGKQNPEAAPIAEQKDGVSLPGDLARDENSAQHDFPGRIGPVGKEQIEKALSTLKKYKAGKESLEKRIVENEKWFKLQHWEEMRQKNVNKGDPEPSSAWLFNSIINKHADAMDNYPTMQALPREKDDEQDAKMLSDILPVIFEQNNYEQTYSSIWWYKLKQGTGAVGVFWDNSANNGLGDIDIRKIDLLNLFWEPGITDIQKSRNVFHVDLIDNDLLIQQYPFMKDHVGGATLDTAQYVYDDSLKADKSEKSVVVDWYYKVKNPNGKNILHFCKFCNGEVLYASENDTEPPTSFEVDGVLPNGQPLWSEHITGKSMAERGFYDHGKYPFDLDPLFEEEGSPAGFGYIDVGKSPQKYIDKLDQVILKHSIMGSRVRYFVRGDGYVNEAEFSDWTKEFVHVPGSGSLSDNLVPITVPSLDGAYLTVQQNKIEELKETTGNRDFAQGGTSGGITAASAIAALQEAGSKLSRDMIKSSYRAHQRICYLVIELIRQFYTEDRWFRILGENGNGYQYVSFNGQRIAAKPNGTDFGQDMGYRVPIFDIKISSMKASPYSTVVENERAKELYGLGFFNPQFADQALAALDMMKFEGVEKVRQRISDNGTLYQQVQQMQQQMLQMAQIIDALNPGQGLTTNMANGFAAQNAQNSIQPAGSNANADSSGNENGIVESARARAASGATPT